MALVAGYYGSNVVRYSVLSEENVAAGCRISIACFRASFGLYVACFRAIKKGRVAD